MPLSFEGMQCVTHDLLLNHTLPCQQHHLMGDVEH
jgi:hypothetical protein